jgi:hypothetical protein
MATKKPRKPRLTKAVVDKLETLTSYAEANANELLSSNDDDQRKHAEKILEAVAWIGGLCHWYDKTHKAT